MANHVDNLKDTHNWYVKVLVETGIVGLMFVLFMLQQMLAVSYRLFRRADDPLYRGLGLGLFLAIFACFVANMFGDRWTYLEITGPLWVLVGAAVCATQLPEFESATEATTVETAPATNPYTGLPISRLFLRHVSEPVRATPPL